MLTYLLQRIVRIIPMLFLLSILSFIIIQLPPGDYLTEYLKDDPLRVWRGWRRTRQMPGYRRARRRFLRDLWRDPTANRLRRFGQACVLAAELPADVGRLYVHFLHTPASVARYAALMTGLPWCASAHAKDIWITPAWELREKLAELDWLVTCTETGRRYLQDLADDRSKIGLIYHGLDFTRFPAPEPRVERADGAALDRRVELLSVGRAVEKKGFDDLLAALVMLPEDLHWHLTHIGGGDGLGQLKAQARSLGLAGRITWRGAQPQTEVLAAYRAADLFVMACKQAADGDRDGLPNVLMEAQSQGLACLSTRVSAIPELIEDGHTGVLVPPGDPAALAEALARLIRDPGARAHLGAAGASRVRARFAMDVGIDALATRLGPPPPAQAAE